MKKILTDKQGNKYHSFINKKGEWIIAKVEDKNKKKDNKKSPE